MTVKGALVLDEMIIPIVDIAFINEIVVITAQLRGPIKAGTAKKYYVNGEDGKTLFGGECDQAWPDLDTWQVLSLSIGFNIAGKHANYEDKHEPFKVPDRLKPDQVWDPVQGFTPWEPPASGHS